ncbi:hypothetical protein ACQVTW_13990 [Bacillus mycoides]|uniref:hypothetical protein n=1 Tax=Bacillus mycoides TaxID=1405 RepID=UPI003D65AC2B
MSQFSKKELEALEHVKKHKNLEPYFFEKLIQKSDAKWLELLKKRGFFDKTNIPVVSEGNYIEEWNVLNYLASIAGELVSNDNRASIEYILEILLQAAEISKNYLVFYQSVKILKNIPAEYVTSGYIDSFLDYWLDYEFGSEHILQEIKSELLPCFLDDPVMLISIFKKFFRESIGQTSKCGYVLNDLIEKKQILFKMIEINPKETLELFIQLLEKECFTVQSNTTINEQVISIQNKQDEYFSMTGFVSIPRKKFNFRENDINFIINNLEVFLEDIDNKKLDSMCKLLYGSLFDKYAYESIFEEKEYRFDATDYLIDFIKITLTKSPIKKAILVSLVKNMIHSKYDLVKKLAIFTIVQKWGELKETFLGLLTEETHLFDYIFRHYIFDDETKHLFNLLTNEVDEKYVTVLEEIISRGEYIFQERESQLKGLKWKQKRYKALKDVIFFRKKLEEIKRITNIEIELSPAIKTEKAGFVEQLSPYSQEQILKMPLDELITKMVNFKEDCTLYTHLKEVSYIGFGEELKKVIISSPDYFIDDLDKFKGIQYEFAYYLLDGFNVLTKQNFGLNYKNVLDFIVLYTSQCEFWADDFRLEKENKSFIRHENFLKQAINFITELVSNDQIDFTETHLDLIVKFFSDCQKKINFESIEEVLFSNKDISFYSLNSLGGIYARALLEIALKIKRISLSNYQDYWQKSIKLIYEDLMANNSIDSYYILGEFMVNFSYIDKNWTMKKVEIIDFSNKMWKYFMSGYLSSRTIYYEFYELLSKNYIKAMEYDKFVDNGIKQKLANHIMVGYINGFEEKTGVRLLQKSLELWDTDIIEALIRNCFNVEKKQLAKGVSRKDAKTKILRFWNEIISICSSKGSVLDKRDVTLIRHTAQLVANFTMINRSIVNNLTFSFKYITNSYEIYDIVEYCERLIDKNTIEERSLTTELIFQLFIQCIPFYQEEKVKKLLSYLKEHNESSKLEEILMNYIKKGINSFVVHYISEILKVN